MLHTEVRTYIFDRARTKIAFTCCALVSSSETLLSEFRRIYDGGEESSSTEQPTVTIKTAFLLEGAILNVGG